jgi:hypothetical protein
MMRTILAPAVLAALLALTASSQVHAYGACRRTVTYTNPETGRSATATESTAVGPNGVYHGASVSGSSPYGAYHATDAHAYSPTMYGGYSAAGTTEHGYEAGVVRYP